MIPGSDKDHPSLFKSFAFAIQGFCFAFTSERNIKVMAGGFAFCVVMGLLLRCTPVEWACLLIGCGVVLSAELFNTSIETLVDLVSPEYNTLAGRAKDIAAAAVYTLSVLVAVMGIVIFVTAALRMFG
ncbi:diacylglycerol kinase family protein [Atopobiaceae bacterium 24-176]